MKERILKVVKWLIRYREPIIQTNYVEIERKIQKVRWVGESMRWLHPNELDEMIAVKIGQELARTRMIDINFSTLPDHSDARPKYKIEAELNVVQPTKLF